MEWQECCYFVHMGALNRIKPSRADLPRAATSNPIQQFQCLADDAGAPTACEAENATPTTRFAVPTLDKTALLPIGAIALSQRNQLISYTFAHCHAPYSRPRVRWKSQFGHEYREISDLALPRFISSTCRIRAGSRAPTACFLTNLLRCNPSGSPGI